MEQPDSTTKATFEVLFGRLLSTVAEEHAIKTNGGTVTTLIEVRDRLQGLRSDLAAVRNRLVTETTARLSDRHPGPARPFRPLPQHEASTNPWRHDTIRETRPSVAMTP